MIRESDNNNKLYYCYKVTKEKKLSTAENIR